MLAAVEAMRVERRDGDDGRLRLVVVATAARLNGPVQFTFLVPAALAAMLWDGLAEALAGGPYDPCLDRYVCAVGPAEAARALAREDAAAWARTRPAGEGVKP